MSLVGGHQKLKEEFSVTTAMLALNRSRALRLYELSNLEPYCQIGGLEAVPLKLDYW